MIEPCSTLKGEPSVEPFSSEMGTLLEPHRSFKAIRG